MQGQTFVRDSVIPAIYYALDDNGNDLSATSTINKTMIKSGRSN